MEVALFQGRRWLGQLPVQAGARGGLPPVEDAWPAPEEANRRSRSTLGHPPLAVILREERLDPLFPGLLRTAGSSPRDRETPPASAPYAATPDPCPCPPAKTLWG